MNASVVTIETPLTVERFSGYEEAAAESGRAEGSGAPGAQARLRLTRRGRFVFGALTGLLALGLLGAIALLGGGTQAFASADAEGAEFGYVIAQPGASLWQIADELDPSSDPRDLVSEIVRLNQLSSSAIEAGQAIAVPLRFSDAPGVVNASDLGL